MANPPINTWWKELGVHSKRRKRSRGGRRGKRKEEDIRDRKVGLAINQRSRLDDRRRENRNRKPCCSSRRFAHREEKVVCFSSASLCVPSLCLRGLTLPEVSSRKIWRGDRFFRPLWGALCHFLSDDSFLSEVSSTSQQFYDLREQVLKTLDFDFLCCFNGCFSSIGRKGVVFPLHVYGGKKLWTSQDLRDLTP